MQDFIDRQSAGLLRALAKPLAVGRRPPFRLGDLLAGLALRYERPEVLAALAAATLQHPGWQGRREKWLAPDSAWWRRWTAEGPLAWSWHDGGVLTRSLLPLKLSA